MTPKDLEPYYTAYTIREKSADRDRWEQGIYNHVAVAVAIDKTFNGKKSTSKYFEKPIHQAEETTKQQDEAMKKARLIFANLEIMQSNFKINKEKQEAGN